MAILIIAEQIIIVLLCAIPNLSGRLRGLIILIGELLETGQQFLLLAATVRLDAALLARLVDPTSVGPAAE